MSVGDIIKMNGIMHMVDNQGLVVLLGVMLRCLVCYFLF
jgi:hypothetical protein